MKLWFDPINTRNKVETVFFVLKRKFGESLKARKYRLQVKEIKIKVILYNLSRFMGNFSLLVVVEFSTKPNLQPCFKNCLEGQYILNPNRN